MSKRKFPDEKLESVKAYAIDRFITSVEDTIDFARLQLADHPALEEVEEMYQETLNTYKRMVGIDDEIGSQSSNGSLLQ